MLGSQVEAPTLVSLTIGPNSFVGCTQLTLESHGRHHLLRLALHALHIIHSTQPLFSQLHCCHIDGAHDARHSHVDVPLLPDVDFPINPVNLTESFVKSGNGRAG